MALTDIQRRVCRVIAANRRSGGESYVAGGVALNELVGGRRLSKDIDLFHDTAEAVNVAFDADKSLLEHEGFRVRLVRERPGYVEAQVSQDSDSALLQWTRDSAFRFFPLVENEELGLVLHPFDLATNKVLALVGRLEARDWVDLISCHERIQPLGYLAWAACGKDPAFTPAAILEQAARTARYSDAELRELDFDGPPPDSSELARRWHAALEDARKLVTVLRSETAGQCVLDGDGNLFMGSVASAREAIASDSLRYHSGSIRGAYPSIK